MTYECPVCDHPGLDCKPYASWPPPEGLALSPPYNEFLGMPSYEVCPQCGFEFGFDDDPGTDSPGDSFESYREKWIAEGRPWFDQGPLPPVV